MCVNAPVHGPIVDMAASGFGYVCVCMNVLYCVFGREEAGHFPVLFAWQSGDMQNDNVLSFSLDYSDVCFNVNRQRG